MKLYYDKNSKDPIYYVQMGFRNGKKTSTRNVARIGKHSELLARVPDPLAHAKAEVLRHSQEYKAGKIDMSVKIDFGEKLSASGPVASKTTLLNVGYFVLQKIYQDLRLADFFKGVQAGGKATFDCSDVNRFLAFARILEPKSKMGTFDRLGSYYGSPSFEYQHILRFMDVMEKNYDGYLEHLYINSENVVRRNTSICYFDCTNYYFEIEEEDADYVDEVTGEIIKGFRKYGPSKQHQPSPLVQMGLFMDGNGIPISMCVHPGSDNEQLSAVPLEKKISKMFRGKPFIYCADAGLGSLSIRQYNSFGGRAYIVTQSVKKLSAPLQRAIFSDIDYRLLSSDAPVTISHMKGFDRAAEANRPLYDDRAYKTLDVENEVDVGMREEKTFKNGKTRKVKSKAVLKQRIIATFSRKMMEYQRSVRNGQIERAKNIISHKTVEDVKKGPHDVTRFIKRTSVGKGGERASDYYTLDQAAIEAEEKYDGYYAVATNLGDDAKTVLGINSKRCKIEDCFRVLKTNFRARPIYHRNRERIVAHFMICYTALLVYRLLENKLIQYGSSFTIENIIGTLRNMNVANVQDMYYMSTYTGSEVCAALNGIYGLGLDKKYYQPKSLNKIIKNISK
jgi:transposase